MTKKMFIMLRISVQIIDTMFDWNFNGLPFGRTNITGIHICLCLFALNNAIINIRFMFEKKRWESHNNIYLSRWFALKSQSYTLPYKQ